MHNLQSVTNEINLALKKDSNQAPATGLRGPLD